MHTAAFQFLDMVTECTKSGNRTDPLLKRRVVEAAAEVNQSNNSNLGVDAITADLCNEFTATHSVRRDN